MAHDGDVAMVFLLTPRLEKKRRDKNMLSVANSGRKCPKIALGSKCSEEQ